MILTTTAIELIKSDTQLKRELTYQLEISYQTLMRWLTENESDGPATRVKFINIVSESTGLTQDQILESEKVIA